MPHQIGGYIHCPNVKEHYQENGEWVFDSWLYNFAVIWWQISTKKWPFQNGLNNGSQQGSASYDLIQNWGGLHRNTYAFQLRTCPFIKMFWWATFKFGFEHLFLDPKTSTKLNFLSFLVLSVHCPNQLNS